jgi:hypothetical protein
MRSGATVFNHFVTSVALVTIGAGSVFAQAPPARATAPAREQQQARHNIYVMEGVLERAVEYGGDQVRRQVKRVMPDMLLMSGAAEARGVRLDGYGVFFDVAVPVLRRTVAWTLKTMMEDNGPAMTAALQQLKGLVDRVGDPREKANLQQAIRRIELQVAPAQPAAPMLAGAPARGAVTSLEAAEPPEALVPPSALPIAPVVPIDRAILTNPSEAYEKEVINALIDAMLEHGGAIGVGPDEWLTVAARDNEQRDRLTPGDSYDLMTIILRIKGSDIAAFRGERITKEEARKRVEIREF